MPDIVEALDRALAKRYRLAEPLSPATTKRGRETRMRHLEKVAGGPGAAAKAAGISARSWRDWKAGTHPPSARGLRHLEASYARQIIRPKVEAALGKKPPPRYVNVWADVVGDPKPGGARYMNRGPNKDHPAYRLFKAEKINTERMVNAWMSAGPEAAVAALTEAIGNVYSTEFGFEGTNVRVEFP